ncbi:MAG: ribonuclease HI [Methylocystaceae bacterium]|nr:ribonuclease HI [Methylocystaceae bacterium]
MKTVTIYTDGACSGNPGPGGYGAVLSKGSNNKEISGFEPETTSNRMELTAAIKALEVLTKSSPVTIYTDSQYVQKGITEWIAGWKRKGWKTSAKKPVKNADLWQRLDELNQKFTITWEWVKGHSGIAGNERADTLAQEAIINAAK